MIKKEYLYLVLIFFFALFLRTWQLHRFPTGISHVEMDYVINAKSIWLTGKDISQTWNPMKLTALDSREILAEWSSLVLAPIIGPLNNSVFNARLFNALIQSFCAVVIYFIVKKLLNKNVGLIAALVYAINPWSFHFGRTAYEVSTSLSFFLLYYLVLIYAKKWKVLYAFPFIVAAFFTYHGFKFLFLPFAFFSILTSFLFIDKKKNFKPYLVIFLLCLSLMFGYLFKYKTQAANKRTSEIFFLNNTRTSQQVNKERLESIDLPLKNITSNKLSFLTRDFTSRYLSAFSASYFFVYGDTNGVGGHTLWTHGYFYYLDFLFLMIGFVAMFSKNRKVWLTLSSFALVAPIPSAINSTGTSFVHRSALLIPIGVIFIAYGIYFVINSFKKKKLGKTIISILYLVSFANLALIYFVRYPIYGSEGFHLSKRIMAEYIKRVKAKNSEQKIYVVNDEALASFEQYLYFNDEYKKENVDQIGKAVQENSLELNNVNFNNRCLPIEKLTQENTIVIVQDSLRCESEGSFVSPENEELKQLGFDSIGITYLVDTGQIMKIYNDSLCRDITLNAYSRIQKYSDFDIDKISNEDFCQKWLHRF
jgi:4-amino-4-deoxy-L-arabinose transferase-like glycosyltransferase